jgi:hypothetical protein
MKLADPNDTKQWSSNQPSRNILNSPTDMDRYYTEHLGIIDAQPFIERLLWITKFWQEVCHLPWNLDGISPIFRRITIDELVELATTLTDIWRIGDDIVGLLKWMLIGQQVEAAREVDVDPGGKDGGSSVPAASGSVGGSTSRQSGSASLIPRSSSSHQSGSASPPSGSATQKSKSSKTLPRHTVLHPQQVNYVLSTEMLMDWPGALASQSKLTAEFVLLERILRAYSRMNTVPCLHQYDFFTGFNIMLAVVCSPANEVLPIGLINLIL